MQKILYVEDDLSLIDGLQYTLEASGYMVDNAKTVKEALALFRKNTYDLLFPLWKTHLCRKNGRPSFPLSVTQILVPFRRIEGMP